MGNVTTSMTDLMQLPSKKGKMLSFALYLILVRTVEGKRSVSEAKTDTYLSKITARLEFIFFSKQANRLH